MWLFHCERLHLILLILLIISKYHSWAFIICVILFSGGQDQHQQWTDSWGGFHVDICADKEKSTKKIILNAKCYCLTSGFQGVRYTAVEGMVSNICCVFGQFEAFLYMVQKDGSDTFPAEALQVNQEQIAEILARYFGTGQRWDFRHWSEMRFSVLARDEILAEAWNEIGFFAISWG